MHPGKDGCAIGNIAVNERQVFDAVERGPVRHTFELTPLRGNTGRADAFDQTLLVATPLHQCGDGGEQ